MRYCGSCHLNINTHLDKCFLCNGDLNKIEMLKRNPIIYPQRKVSKIKFGKINMIILKLILFMIICGGLINIVTWELKPILWFPILSVGLISFYKILKVYFEDFWSGNFSRFLFLNYLLMSYYVLVIDILTGFQGWSLNYFIPLTGILTIILLIVASAFKGNFWADGASYLFIVLMINMTPMILFLLGVITVLIPSLASLIFVGIIIGSLLLFKRKKFKAELFKRLHY